jgi:thioredoxin-like negative regulator of GroEL
LLIAAAVLVVTTLAGVLWRRRSGRVRAAAPEVLPAGLVPASGAAVTLVQFSSATCAPCRQVRAVCEDVAGALTGVQHVELDAEAHLDAVRELSIWRLPTLLVVDRAGQVARRTVGVPDRAALREAVQEVMA